MNEQLGLDSSNYNLVKIELKDDDYMLVLNGINEWNGLFACGTIRNIKVTEDLDECVTDDMGPTISLVGGKELLPFR